MTSLFDFDHDGEVILERKSMKHLVIAEKPSVGRDIAKVLHCSEKHGGYISGDEYVITWGIGHLVTACMPADIDSKYSEWKMEDLPITPEPIPLQVIPETEHQYRIVSEWMNSSEIDEIICATDAGREGELIFRYIYQMAGCHKPVKRLWISSMTPQAIREGFENLKPGEEYDKLYQSARCRADADWLIGINGSRAYSIKHDAKLSIGRVQSPTLAILVDREWAIQNFVPEKYHVLYVNYGSFKGEWYDPSVPAENANRIPEERKAELQSLLVQLSGSGAVVRESRTEHQAIPSPQLYDLTTLQRDANRLYGFTAKQVLSIVQKLYEVRKAVTYPRTDSRYLSHDMASTLKRRLEVLNVSSWQHALQQAKVSTKNLFGRFINDTGVTDHHAIVPTGYCCFGNDWTENEKKIFDLIARRFIAMFLPDRELEVQTIVTEALGHYFQSKGHRLAAAGWGEIVSTPFMEAPPLPNCDAGDVLKVIDAEMMEKETTPPSPHTDASLLYAMEHAGSGVGMESSVGLGTPATRADTIEKLINRKYVKRKGKTIIPTPDGIELCSILPQVLKTPELTVQWEDKLAQIGNGGMDAEVFMKGIREMTAEIVKNAPKSGEHTFGPVSLGPCFICGSNVYEGTHNDYYCSKKECKFHIWKAKKGLNPYISPEDMKDLLAKGVLKTSKGVFTLLKEEPFIDVQKAPSPVAKKADLIAFLNEKGMTFVDNTPKGAFWIAGGKGIQSAIKEIEDRLGIVAHYKEDAKALKKKPGWYYTADMLV